MIGGVPKLGDSKPAQSPEAFDLSKFPSTAQVYDMYGYTPPPPQNASENLNINWTPELEQQIVEAGVKAISSVSFEAIKIPNDLEVSFLKTISPEGLSLYFTKSYPTYTNIAELSLQKDASSDSPVWELAHRLVNEKYRAQGIGPKLLSLMEKIVGHQADATAEAQNIVIAARQISVINFALKAGYVPETSEDVHKLEELLEGDNRKIVILTANLYDSPREGYMASVRNAKQVAKSIPDFPTREMDAEGIRDVMGKNLPNFLSVSCTINFIKKISPSTPPSLLL